MLTRLRDETTGIRVDGQKEILGIRSNTFRRAISRPSPLYGAPNLKDCRAEFERFCQVWAKYPGAIAVWKRCFAYVEQLFDYPSAVRKIMYTTNAIEAVNSSFRKVTKRGAFPGSCW